MHTLKAFTLIELLVTLTLIATFLMIAIPSWQELKQSSQATVVIDQLIGEINLARSEAITRGVTVTLCGSADQHSCSDQWSKGQIIFIDATHDILKVFDLVPAGGYLLWQGSRSLTDLQFTPFGTMKVQNGKFIYCPQNKDRRFTRGLILSITGRVRVVNDVAC